LLRALAAIIACFVLIAVCSAHAQYQDPREPKTKEDRDFYTKVVRAIQQKAPLQDGKFVLTLAKRVGPLFPAKNADTFEKVDCEMVAAFNVLGYGNEVAQISVSDCTNGSRLRELAVKSRDQAFLKRLSEAGKEADLRKAGLYYSMEKQGDGSEFYYFPVIALGHGMIAIYTGVLFNSKTGHAVVVQIGNDPMCTNFQSYYKDSPICSDLEGFFRYLTIAIDH
jgi:hypothetical protein